MKGGVEASSRSLNSYSSKLVVIRYRDHILLRNGNPKLYFDVNVRESVGWLTQIEDNFIVLTSDRSTDPLPYEVRENVLFIIKSDIVEVREIKINSLPSITDCGKR